MGRCVLDAPFLAAGRYVLDNGIADQPAVSELPCILDASKYGTDRCILDNATIAARRGGGGTPDWEGERRLAALKRDEEEVLLLIMAIDQYQRYVTDMAANED